MLLAKVEELTLYVIAQEKRSREQIEDQRREIAVLHAEIDRLSRE